MGLCLVNNLSDCLSPQPKRESFFLWKYFLCLIAFNISEFIQFGRITCFTLYFFNGACFSELENNSNFFLTTHLYLHTYKPKTKVEPLVLVNIEIHQKIVCTDVALS